MTRSHLRRLSPPLLRAGATFAVFAALFVPIFVSFPVLYDTDSYFHLAVARAYGDQGQLADLPWVRFSLLGPGFGDKELLFHWLLAPLAHRPEAGRVALGLLNAALATTLALLARRAAGSLGLLLPVLVWFGAQDFLGRALRLRPELLSLLLLLVALHLAQQRRDRWLLPVAAVYALSYVAVHAFLGICALWCAGLWLLRRQVRPALFLYPLLGAGAGLLLHPNFPHNLLIIKVHAIDFFRLKDVLDVGTEIRAATSAHLLGQNLWWLLGLVVLWRSAAPAGGPPPEASETAAESAADDVTAAADIAWLTALPFVALSLLMQRFVLYAVPFLSLALLFELRRRGLRPSGRVALWPRGGLPLLGCLLLLLPGMVRGAGGMLWGMARARSDGSGLEREDDWARFGSVLPAGARVAAEWGLTPPLAYFAPQARYLNVLDPMLMALPFPEAYALERQVFAGRALDLPLVLAAGLDSEYLAASRYSSPPRLLAQLADDPRLVPLYAGHTLLHRIEPRARRFLLDWRIAPPPRSSPALAPHAQAPPASDPQLEIAGWPAYPRHTEPRLLALEGFVDLSRLAPESFGPEHCATLVATVPPASPGCAALWELAPAGAATLWQDGALVVTLSAAEATAPGGGALLPLRAGASLAVRSCARERGRTGVFSRGGFSDGGFYLIDRTECGADAPAATSSP